MSMFRRYDHLEHLGRSEVKGINTGECYIFPKLDGTNASVWAEEKPRLVTFHCASRNRELSLESDNAGFCAWVQSRQEKARELRTFCRAHPHLIVYGEWLVPHSLRTYREECWHRFYIFDVFDRNTGRYLPYHEYNTLLIGYEQDVIPPLCLISSPITEELEGLMRQNTYGIKEGEGVGEGIVIKNYNWTNCYGRQPWAKKVRTGFKAVRTKPLDLTCVEASIAERYITKALVDKIRAKILQAESTRLGPLPAGYVDEDWAAFERKNRGKIIPQLLSCVYYDVVHEDLWDALKRHKDPTIDFRKLRTFTTQRVKELADDLF